MLLAGKEVKGFSLEATDGRIGKVEDLFFEPDGWRIRYWVVNPGSLLFDRSVLIPTESTGSPVRERRGVPVRLSRGQVQTSPDWESGQPVSVKSRKESGEHGLLSAADLRSYRISAPDGEFGHIADVLFEPATARIQYLIIDPRNFFPGKHVIFPVSWVVGLDWEKRALITTCSNAEISYSFPKYGGSDSLDTEHAEFLERYFEEAEANPTIRKATRVRAE